MTGQAQTLEQFAQTIAGDVSERLGMSMSGIQSINKVLGDIKLLLAKVIDTDTTVQPSQKLPTILSKSFKDISEKIQPTTITRELLEDKPSLPISRIEVQKQEPLKVEEQKPLEVQKQQQQNFINKQINAFEDTLKSLQTKKDPVDILEQIEKPKPMLFAGFTSDGLKSIKENLPEIIEKGTERLFKNVTEPKKDKGSGFDFPGMGIVKGALGVLSIVGGVFTLLYGLQTDGPFKGLAKLAGKGMLEIGKILTAPFKGFIASISELLLKAPLDMIKTFGAFISNSFKGIASFGLELATKAGKTILAPINHLVKFISNKFLSIPLNLLNSFKGSILGLFEKVGGSSIIKTGLGRLTNFLPNMLKGLTPILKKVPIISTLISLSYAVSRFRSGDYLGGGIDILSGIAAMVPGIGTAMAIGLDGLNAFLDIKAGGATGKQTRAKIDLLKGIGVWIGEKITKLPIIGPLVKAAQYLAAREWKKGLKQLAYAIPVVDAVAAFLGDEEASGTSKAFAGAVKEVKWSEIGSWLFETFKSVPIIGPLMKAVENFTSGEYLKGLKQLAYINPVFEAIGGMFGDSEAGTISTEIGKWGVDLVTDLSKWIIDSLSEMIDIGAIKDSILGAAQSAWESRPWWLGGNGEKDKSASSTTSQETVSPSTLDSTTAPSNQQVTPVGDAKIKSDGGLIVSSPTEGSLFQLSKKDGIVAAPFESPDNNIRQTQSNSFAKAETILEKIANNTGFTNQSLSNLINGFNNLAKALKESGTIKEAPLVINQADQQQSKFAGVAQYAAAMSSPARSYNASFAEAMKPIRI